MLGQLSERKMDYYISPFGIISWKALWFGLLHMEKTMRKLWLLAWKQCWVAGVWVWACLNVGLFSLFF